MNRPIRIGEAEEHAAERSGLLHGFGAYLIWGLLPLYFKLLPGVSSVEIVAYRIVWSVAFLAILLVMTRLYPVFAGALRQPRILGALTLSALFIAANWLVYIWAVNNGHVLAGSLGYFLNPLVNILLGMVFLGERLRRVQVLAVLIAAVGVAILAAGELQTLWISLTLAITFGLYGFVRKLTPVSAPVGLSVETLVLLPIALAALGWFVAHGELAFGGDALRTALLIGSGVITSVPLILFANAARRLSMTTLGLLQYVSPTLQFLSGAVVLGEPLTATRLASFGFIWAALALFVWDSLRRRGRSASA